MKDITQGQTAAKPPASGKPFVISAALLVAILIGPIVTGPPVGPFAFLDRYAGVVVLVSLSLAVMLGLACTDRLVLPIRFRILFQDVHRATALIGVGFLAVHIVAKVIASEAAALEAVVPFFRSIPVGLGTVAGYLMVMVAALGVFRLRYLNKGRPWVWRLLHSTAYLCWPIGLVHGLSAGRPAASWVTLSYAACLVAVGFGLLVRVMFAKRIRRGIGVVKTRGGAAGESPYAIPGKMEGGDEAFDAEFWASLRKEVRR